MNAGPIKDLSWQVSSLPTLTIGAGIGDASQELYGIRGVAQFPDGAIAVVNSGSHDVRFYDGSGNHVRTVGGRGRGPTEFTRPSLVPSPTYDSLVVTEGSGRLRVVSRDGSIRYVAQLQRTEMNVGVVNDRLVNAQLRPDTSRGLGRSWSIADLLAEDPASGSRTALVSLPWIEVFREGDGGGVVVAPGVETSLATGKAAIHAAVSGTATIRTYGAAGTLRRVVKIPLEERAPNAAEFETILDWRVRAAAGPEAARLRKRYEDVGPPTNVPLLDRLLEDSEGYVWARQYSPMPGPFSTWLVIDSSGVLHGRLMLPEFSVQQIGSGFILGVAQTDDGVEQVVRYSLTR